ncbi:MAG: hypothetical protein M1830_008992 [Pleopsidium flavum]|nr:MAG: hypothetical protein M1830_008992 [Pleopsidium flavum]
MDILRKELQELAGDKTWKLEVVDAQHGVHELKGIINKFTKTHSALIQKIYLWELNGGMQGPVDRGALDSDEDALCEKALQLGVRSFSGQESAGW